MGVLGARYGVTALRRYGVTVLRCVNSQLCHCERAWALLYGCGRTKVQLVKVELLVALSSPDRVRDGVIFVHVPQQLNTLGNHLLVIHPPIPVTEWR